jgi:hypothetical protein
MYRKDSWIAGALLALMFALMFFSAKGDAAIMDELAHIPAGYSYITQKDMRLNPEHPPLMKDLAGVSLLMLHPNFPTNVKPWTEDINGQWDMGRIFLYDAGNNPDQILLWARLPMMLLALLFGWMLFAWARKRYGPKVGLLSLFFFALSPTFVAHSRYVTTDLAAAFAFFIGIMTFIDFIENPTRGNIIKAGIAFGIAQLFKFSLFLLVPIYGVMALLWILIAHKDHLARMGFGERLEHRIKYGAILIGKIILIGLIGIAIIWVVYEYHVWNYPKDRQLHDATEILSSFGKRWLVDLDLWLIAHNATRALGQYMLGLLMVIQRAAGGNTTYFLGELSNTGWWYYFPIAYLLKETLALHLLTLVALIVAIAAWLRSQSFKGIAWTREHIGETVMLFFIAFYWTYSMRSPLNIGVRHVLPTFPFIYLLVSRMLISWIERVPDPNPATESRWLHNVYRLHIESIPKYLVIIVLMFWGGFQTVIAYPNYLSYYNELVGSKRGYLYIVDSNYDWGQDLKRLAAITHANNIDHIALEYFGGGSPQYYIGSAFEPWWAGKGKPQGYFAISATLQQGALGKSSIWYTQEARDIWREKNTTGATISDTSLELVIDNSVFNKDTLRSLYDDLLGLGKPHIEDTDVIRLLDAKTYHWLRGYHPIARAGESIFIYDIQ